MDTTTITFDSNLPELAEKFEQLSKLLKEIDGFKVELNSNSST